MKIIYIIDHLNGINGGTERQLYKLIEGMVSHRHEVELYVLRATSFTRDLIDFPCSVSCLGIGSILSILSLRKLYNFRRLLITKKIEVLHGFFNDTAIILPVLTFGLKISSYTSRRDMGIWYSPVILLFLRLFRYSKTKLICNSLAVAGIANKIEWKPHETILVIHNGIEALPQTADTKVFDWAPKRQQNEYIINIILVANVRPVKHIEDLVKAASHLSNSQYSINYYVVGQLSDKHYFESLLAMVKHYHLESNFHFVGRLAEPRHCLSLFDVGVLTSESEGFSNTIMEYMDAGLPVVASRVGGNPELVVDGHNGFLYQVGDFTALADCLYKLIVDRSLRQIFASNNKEAVRQFGIDSMIELHERVYANQL